MGIVLDFMLPQVLPNQTGLIDSPSKTADLDAHCSLSQGIPNPASRISSHNKLLHALVADPSHPKSQALKMEHANPKTTLGWESQTISISSPPVREWQPGPRPLSSSGRPPDPWLAPASPSLRERHVAGMHMDYRDEQ